MRNTQVNRFMPADAPSQKSTDILIVEDDATLANILRVRFVNFGITAEIAKDGQEAIEFLRKNQPKIILLDILLPKKNGFDVLREAAEEKLLERIPIFIVSNLYQESNVEQGKALGATQYFVKANISIDELVEQVQKYLKGSA